MKRYKQISLTILESSGSGGSSRNTIVNIKENQSLKEDLFIRPLVNGKIYTHAQFTTEWSSNFNNRTTFQHYDLFPRSMGDLITRVGLEEMTLKFTQGRWSYEEWGYPIRSAPVGVELVAWFKPLDKGVDAQWKELTHSLAGLFCANMQSLYKVPEHTSSPLRSFRPEGESNVYYGEENSTPAIYNMRKNTTTPLQVRYGLLPRESVCTENLTPWLKLLPCRSQSGLAKLLNPHRLYDVHYHSMSITIRKVQNNQNNNQVQSPILQSIQTLSIVHDIPPKEPNKKLIDINFGSLFGVENGLSSCPLASSSKVYIKKSDNQLAIEPKATQDTLNYLVYDLTSWSTSNPLKLLMKWNRSFKKDSVSPVIAHSHLTGYGQERGGIAIQIYNNFNHPINITYYQAIPWYLRIYFHTFKCSINNNLISNQDFKFIKFNPSEFKSSPSTIEFSLELGADTVASMSIDFDKVFLHYTAHPPDANRGFDLGSGVVTTFIDPKYFTQTSTSLMDIESPTKILQQEKEKKQISDNDDDSNSIPVHIYTEGLLITLPTPDFSMLYNVITLTGTVFALFFGSIINILIRRLKDTFTGDDFVSDRPIAKLYRKIMKFIDKKE
ncbi:hypothetical protein DFA_03194 [Cavenderia fasciculata]|uniref:GPI transamidase component PIG-T n=1 Tax=Cavenderia fasciculata TaxID=261658 RepID=F4PGW5_CACFS|nr:uncharacterized protein DFA_03194 [Cavenderia fasciculata]EGG24949.1 hypothetical protein DFA_03194 [Cavenderia fasciculata]|eukprot:XP_004362800.1 hypothetical protein DFA_03194 [Cavenderia fasciculata]